MSQRGLREESPVPPCSRQEELPRPPRIEVDVVRELSRSSEGFLQLREVELRNRYEDGSSSGLYHYFMVERSRLDAVAIVLYRKDKQGIELVLRSQLRPPLWFRAEYEVPLPETGTGAVQWELPAGLIELGERGHEGIAFRAAAEALEEVGVVLPPERFLPLGPPSSLSPGVLAEKLHFVWAEILDTDEWRVADGDGHILESHSRCVFVSLESALRALDTELVHDSKTEIGIHRLAAQVARSLAASDLRSRAEPPASTRGPA